MIGNSSHHSAGKPLRNKVAPTHDSLEKALGALNKQHHLHVLALVDHVFIQFTQERLVFAQLWFGK